MNQRPRLAKTQAKLKIENTLKTNLKEDRQTNIPAKMAQTITFSFDSLIQNINNFEAKKEQEIDYFLEQFHNLCEVTKLPDDLRIIILKSKLSGNAKQILMNTPELKDETNYAELKQKLSKTFTVKKSFGEAQQKFTNLKQRPNQTVEEFIKEFNVTAQKYLNVSGHASKDGAKDLLETIKLNKFIDSLRPDIGFEVRKQGPEEFSEAVKLAKKIELALNIPNPEINNINTKPQSSVLDALLQATQDQSSKMNELQEQINTLKLTGQHSNTKNNKYCHICEKNNHDTQFCFYNSKNKTTNNTKPTNNSYSPRHTFNQPKPTPRPSMNYWPRQEQPRQISQSQIHRFTSNTQPQQNFQRMNMSHDQTYQNMFPNNYLQPSFAQCNNMPNNFIPAHFPQNFMSQAPQATNFVPGWGYNAQIGFVQTPGTFQPTNPNTNTPNTTTPAITFPQNNTNSINNISSTPQTNTPNLN